MLKSRRVRPIDQLTRETEATARPNILNDLSEPGREETVMAKKKKATATKRATKTTAKAKMSGRKTGKQVKGRVSRMTDPCEGGE